MTAAELARVAYDAYGTNRGWETHDGRPMPAWGDLPEAIRGAWIAASRAVALVVADHVAPACDADVVGQIREW